MDGLDFTIDLVLCFQVILQKNKINKPVVIGISHVPVMCVELALKYAQHYSLNALKRVRPIQIVSSFRAYPYMAFVHAERSKIFRDVRPRIKTNKGLKNAKNARLVRQNEGKNLSSMQAGSSQDRI